jgi:hypothetical protein
LEPREQCILFNGNKEKSPKIIENRRTCKQDGTRKCGEIFVQEKFSREHESSPERPSKILFIHMHVRIWLFKRYLHAGQ